MTRHALSAEDRRFLEDFEAGRYPPERFDHRAHVKLAYVYLAESDTETATSRLRRALLAFLGLHGLDASKYHATMTAAWILAVRHFMHVSAPAACADAFIEANPTLLDSRIMLSHYSADLLFSKEARAHWVEPDLAEIPRHQA